jgi:hypothetical protein
MELVIFAILLMIVLVIWGLSSLSASYAAAKQAQATIEVARAAQISSAGNLATILITVLVVFVVLILISLGIWLFYQLRIKPALKNAGILPNRNSRRRLDAGQPDQPSLQASDPLGLLTQMMALQMYQQMQADLLHRRQEQPALPEDNRDHWMLP